MSECELLEREVVMVTRILDVLLAGSAIVALMPVFLPVIVILRLTGEGEVFYRQERIGRACKKFDLLKFATMLKNSANIGTGTITIKNDPRVLPVGRFLRKTKINELPQLFNILLGHMSVVGPRPLTVGNFDMYPGHLRGVIASVKPGLSGIGSIIFRDEENLLSDKSDPVEYYRCEIAPYKAALEVWYVSNQGVRTYWKCIVVTAWVVLRPRSRLADSMFKGLPAPGGQLRVDLGLEPTTLSS